MAAEPLTLPALLEQLAKHGMRVAKVDLFASGVVASFTTAPASVPAPAAREEAPPDPDALEAFVHRKERRE